MFVLSVTRLHLASLWHLPLFAFSVYRSTAQVKDAPGFVAGILAREPPRGFWTVTLWKSEQAMREFRNSGVHSRAMPRLLRWCDEASYVHWEQGDSNLPSNGEIHRRLRDEGRLSKVNRPSGAHLSGRTASDEVPKEGLRLSPAGCGEA